MTQEIGDPTLQNPLPEDVEYAEHSAFARAKKTVEGPTIVDLHTVQKITWVVNPAVADFVTANTFDMTIDGVPMTQVPFNTTHAQTMTDIATEIQTEATVATAQVTGTHTITVVGLRTQVGTAVPVLTNLLTLLGATQNLAGIASSSESIQPVSGAVSATSASITLLADKVYRVFSSSALYFRMTNTASTAVTTDIYLAANTPIILAPRRDWSILSFVRSTADGTIQALEVK